MSFEKAKAIKANKMINPIRIMVPISLAEGLRRTTASNPNITKWPPSSTGMGKRFIRPIAVDKIAKKA